MLKVKKNILCWISCIVFTTFWALYLILKVNIFFMWLFFKNYSRNWGIEKKKSCFLLKRKKHSHYAFSLEFLHWFLGNKWQEDSYGLKEAQSLLSQYGHPFERRESKHTDYSPTMSKHSGTLREKQKTRKDRAVWLHKPLGDWLPLINIKYHGPTALTVDFYLKLQLI